MTKKESSKNPAADVAKERKLEDIITLRSGVRIKLIPVPASLVDAVTSKIPEPEIPVKELDDGRETLNPLDPQYEKDMDEVRRLRGIAAIDAFALFGVELIDGLPPDEEWLVKLELMEKRGLIDVLKDYDLDDPTEKELVYKKFVGVTTDIITKVTEISGVSPEEIAAAEESFQSN
ncbi:MAG: hypothetical protein ACYTFW_00375 [Planctomycetota bacterium]|jgi:hypothetical protein